jgi:hypothetical protein
MTREGVGMDQVYVVCWGEVVGHRISMEEPGIGQAGGLNVLMFAVGAWGQLKAEKQL